MFSYQHACTCFMAKYNTYIQRGIKASACYCSTCVQPLTNVPKIPIICLNLLTLLFRILSTLVSRIQANGIFSDAKITSVLRSDMLMCETSS